MKHFLAHSKWEELSHYCIIKQCSIPNKLRFLHRKFHQTVKMMGIVHSNAWHKEDQTVLFCFFFASATCLLFHPTVCTILGTWIVKWINELWTGLCSSHSFWCFCAGQMVCVSPGKCIALRNSQWRGYEKYGGLCSVYVLIVKINCCSNNQCLAYE